MLRSELVEASRLGPHDMAQMYAVLTRHFSATTRGRFEDDLSAKQWALLLRDVTGTIQGFSTIQVYPAVHAGVNCRIIFSGDTIIDRNYWGEQHLAFPWLRLAGGLYSEQPDARFFWFLISKGHRTFRYLPTFARTFFPHWAKTTPSFEAGLLEHAAINQFGEYFLPEKGLVCFPESRGHLREDFAEPTDRELRLEAVRFFLERNPGYRLGHELCCLCELSPANLKPMARRVFLQGVSCWAEMETEWAT